MVRRSSRVSRRPRYFGYNSDYEPYPTMSRVRDALRREGRREIPDVPLEIPKAPETDKQLKVVNVDILKKRNSEEHHTDKYETENLVLRRGQPFYLDVEFDRPYNASKDTISLEMLLGSRPLISSGTRKVLGAVSGPPAHDDAGVQVLSTSGNKASLKGYLESDSLIGLFKLVVCTEIDEEEQYRNDVETGIYIIFNPWCKDDATFMPNEAERKEYVLNDEGIYFYGGRYQIYSAPWYLGQFEAVAIECAFYLLKKGGLSYFHWKEPRHIVRTLSALINREDDDGVIWGEWGDDYSDGVDPTDWSGSISILKDYMDTRRPVKYGQCWVFGCVFTTVMRALGIPSRHLTNFDSAHDTDGNLTLDYHLDEDNMPLPDMNEDSIWNYHVWNDAWMTRPDLPAGYGGWQAVDATPQETSRGSFRMGPTSVAAIKQGHVYMEYDTRFAFAEVNAETVFWKVYDDRKKPPTVFDVESDNVGRNISTKAVGSDERVDITDEYKYPEGTKRERIAVSTAAKYVKKAKNFMKDIPTDVKFRVEIPADVMIGSDVELTVVAENTSRSLRSVSIAVSGSTVYYTGVEKATVVQEKTAMKLYGGETKDFKVTVPAEEYQASLTQSGGFVFFVMGMVSETRQTFSERRDFVLQKPDLNIETEDEVDGVPLEVDQSFSIILSFENPLTIPLTECRFRIEGPGIDGYRLEHFRNVKPLERVTHSMRLTAKRSGQRSIYVTFASKEIRGVKSSAVVYVS